MELVGEFLYSFFLSLVGLAVARLYRGTWRLLRRFPWVLVGLAAACFAFGGFVAGSIHQGMFRTEGSPAGLMIAVVVLGSVALAAVLGLAFGLQGFWDLSARTSGAGSSAALVVGGVALLVGLGVAAFALARMPERKSPAKRGSPDLQRPGPSRNHYRLPPRPGGG